MPVELRREGKAEWITVVLTGDVGPTEIDDFVAALLADADVRGRDILWDLRAGTIASLTPEDFTRINELAERRMAAGAALPVRAAVVAPRDVDFGISRMQQTLAAKLGVEVRVFRNLGDAETWLAA